MPIYEYQCQHCGHHLEELEKVNDAPLVDCPQCGKSSLQRIVSNTSFQLKGGGWYATDYKKDSKSAAKPGPDTPDSTKSDSSKAEASAEVKKSSDSGDEKKS